MIIVIVMIMFLIAGLHHKLQHPSKAGERDLGEEKHRQHGQDKDEMLTTVVNEMTRY